MYIHVSVYTYLYIHTYAAVINSKSNGFASYEKRSGNRLAKIREF